MNTLDLSVSQLKEYTKKAAEIESSVYYLEKIYNDIYTKINQFNRKINEIDNRINWEVAHKPQEPVMPQQPENPKEKSKKHLKKSTIIWGILILMASIANPITRAFIQLFGLIAFPIGAIGFGLYMSNKRQDKEYKDMQFTNAMNAYNQNLASYPSKIEEYNRTHAAYIAEKNNLTQLISQLQATKQTALKKLEETKLYRKQFYSANIIYPTFRSLVPMSRFYEYFDSGMCTTLKEAMNTYNTELQFNKIVDSIDELTEAVYATQIYLSEIRDAINSNMNRISNSIQTVSGQLDVQAYQNQVLAECNKQVANDVKIIKDIETYKLITN